MQAWMIIMIVLCPLLALGINIYLVKAWGSPDDWNRAYFPRAVVVISLVLAEMSVLLLPLDVGARSPSIYGNVGCGYWNSECGDPTQALIWLWIALYVTIAVFVVFIIPFAILFYESWEYKLDKKGAHGGNDFETSCKEQCCAALRWQFVFSIVGSAFLLILYAVFNKVHIPLTGFSASAEKDFIFNYNYKASFTKVGSTIGTLRFEQAQLLDLPMTVTFLIYLVGCISWLGSWFFCIFAGVGLVLLPCDMIRTWKDRPTPLDLATVVKEKKMLLKRADDLLEIATIFKDEIAKAKRKGDSRKKGLDRKNWNKLKVAVQQMEKKADHLEICLEITHDLEPTWTNTLLPWVYLVVGCLGIVISLLWFLQVCLYVLPRAIDAMMGKPQSTSGILFLNEYLQSLDTSVPLFGTLTIAILVFWLQLCMIKGVFSLGLRIFIIGIHPMKYGNTLANTLLVNVSMVLLSSPSLIAFCCECFTSYTRSTDASVIFSVQIRYMDFFRPFYDMGIFTLTFTGFVVLSFIYVCLRACCCYNGQNGIDEARFAKEVKKLQKAK
jgi:LMBR1 domain-containing protein 1